MAPVLDESHLIHACAPLYDTFALESLSNILLFVTFMYLLLIIQTRGELQTPGRAVLRLFWSKTKHHANSVWRTLALLPDMHKKTMLERFAFVRQANTIICLMTACVSLLSLTRLFHVGNVNGFRYLGYALTCPLMQANLVVMVAPVVPCYRITVVTVSFITFLMLVSGYCASIIDDDLWQGSTSEFLLTWSLDDLGPTTKFWVLSPSVVGVLILTFIQLPYMAILYKVHGGVSGGLPSKYLTLLFVVATTWMFFPIWWFLNWQGIGIIKDIRWNAVGFVLLNILSKSLFTLICTSSARQCRIQAMLAKIPEGQEKDGKQVGTLPRPHSQHFWKDMNNSNVTVPLPSWFVTTLQPYDARPCTGDAKLEDSVAKPDVQMAIDSGLGLSVENTESTTTPENTEYTSENPNDHKASPDTFDDVGEHASLSTPREVISPISWQFQPRSPTYSPRSYCSNNTLQTPREFSV